MNSITIDDSLLMRDKAEFAEIELVAAHVSGQLELSGSKVTGKLNMNGIRVDQSILMDNKAEFAEIELVTAHISGQLNLSDSKVTGKLNMSSLKARDLLLNSAEFREEVALIAAQVSGQLNLRASKFNGHLNMNQIQVSQSVLMDDKAEFTDVDFGYARVGGVLSLVGSKVAGLLECSGTEIGGDVFLSRGAEFAGPINFVFNKIRGSLELAGGMFQGTVDLTGTQVDGELRLGSSRHLPARWSDKSVLILRNAGASAIQDLSQAWPHGPASLDLNGFTYRSLGGIYAAELDPMVERRVDWFENEWLSKQGHYAPQPYEQLAFVLYNQGQVEKATAVRYGSREAERQASDGLRYAWLTILENVIGYGYRPMKALYWVMLLTAIGTMIFRSTPDAKKNDVGWGVTYSFDMLLPIIQLRRKHYEIDLSGWQRYYFYFHKIVGFMLASFLIAGLSGLTK